MGYYIDLSKITLYEFKTKLKTTDLLPSQQILKEFLDERFQVLKSQKIDNIQELQEKIKNKKKINDFAHETSLSVDYLTVLRRYINSLHPQARKIKDFDSISRRTKKRLEDLGIKTTPQLYDRLITKSDRDILKKDLKVDNEEILVLTKLADVCRLRYVNPAFATLLVNSDYDSVEKIRNSDYQELYEQLTKINEEKKFYKGKINLKDMKFLVNETETHSLDIEY